MLKTSLCFVCNTVHVWVCAMDFLGSEMSLGVMLYLNKILGKFSCIFVRTSFMMPSDLVPV